MSNRLLPTRIDNDYQGHPIALWFFAPITLLTVGRSLVHIFVPDGGAQSIATIPLDRMTSGGAEGIVLLFALWGLSQLLLGLLYVAVLIRYRALLPLMYLLFTVEYGGRFLIGRWKNIVTVETPPGETANVVFPVLGLVMLVLSLRFRPGRDDPS
ncbi:MAG: hypothetical protein CL933_02660 [Deltaproteobacteria bacterium]|nr:hypothetical protein [Deltaproteobacteria bacterium]